MSNVPLSLAASPAGSRTDSGSPVPPDSQKPAVRTAAFAPVAARPPEARTGGAPKPERSHAAPRKMAPPEQTHAEDFYYVKQIQAKTKLVIVLRDGEEVQGVIEWYDRACIKVQPESEPPVVIYKSAIKYMYKQSEG